MENLRYYKARELIKTSFNTYIWYHIHVLNYYVYIHWKGSFFNINVGSKLKGGLTYKNVSDAILNAYIMSTGIYDICKQRMGVRPLAPPPLPACEAYV